MPSAGNLGHEPAALVSLAAYRAQKRRAAAADARRGAMITLLLLAAGLVAGYTLYREQHLLNAERVHHLP